MRQVHQQCALSHATATDLPWLYWVLATVNLPNLSVANVSAIDIFDESLYILWVLQEHKSISFGKTVPVTRYTYFLNTSWSMWAH
jgi:hypothetical protein